MHMRFSGNRTEYFVMALIVICSFIAIAGALLAQHPNDNVVQMWLDSFSSSVNSGQPATFSLVIENKAVSVKDYSFQVLADGFEKQSGSISLLPGDKQTKQMVVSGLAPGRHKIDFALFDNSLGVSEFGSQQKPYSVSFWVQVG